MKPGRNDRRYDILITGDELRELQRFTWNMAEAYGLDQRIENYKGTRPIGFYRWDLDCLESVLDSAIKIEEEYPGLKGPRYNVMKTLHKRIVELHRKAYAEY